MHNNQASKSTDMMEALPVTIGKSLQQNCGKSCHPTTAATLLEVNQNTPLINSVHPPSPPDAMEGPKAMLSAINAECDQCFV